MRKTRASKTSDGDIGPSINKMQQLVQLSREIKQNAEAAVSSYNNVGGGRGASTGGGGGAALSALAGGGLATFASRINSAGMLGVTAIEAHRNALSNIAFMNQNPTLTEAEFNAAGGAAAGLYNWTGQRMANGFQIPGTGNYSANMAAGASAASAARRNLLKNALNPLAAPGIASYAVGGGSLGVAAGLGTASLFGAAGLLAYTAYAVYDSNVAKNNAKYGSYTSALELQAGGSYAGSAARQRAAAGIAGDVAYQESMGKYLGFARILPSVNSYFLEAERSIAINKGNLVASDKRKYLSGMGARVGLDVDPTLDAQMSMAPSLAMFGKGAMGALESTPLASLNKLYSPEQLGAATSTLARMGSDPRFWGIRGGLKSGDSLSSIAPGAMARLAAQGDLGGIASLIPLTGPGEASKYSKLAMGTLDIQGRQIMSGYGLESAQATMSRTQARGGYVDDSTFGGVKSAMAELVASLKAGAENIKAIVGDKSPLYKEAVAKYSTAEAQLAGADTSRISQKLGYAGGIYNRDVAGIDASATKASLFSSDPGELLRISNYRSQRMGKYEQQVKALISTLPDGPMKDQWKGELSRLAGERVQLGAMGAQSSAQLGLSNLAVSQLPGIVDSSREAIYGSPKTAYDMTTKRINETGGALLANYENQSLPLAFRRSQLAEAYQLMAGEPERAAELQGTLLGRSATVGEINRGERGYALGMASKYGTAADVVGATRGAAAEILGGIGSINDKLANGGLTFDQRAGLIARGQGLRGQLADTLAGGIEDYYRKKDLSGSSLEMMRADEAEKRSSMMPFGMGGMAAAGKSIGLRRGRISELQGRIRELDQAGMLSPEKRFELESQIESLTTQNVASMAPLMSGLEDRFPARRANANGFSRISSMGMASMFHPGLAFGSANGSIAGRQRGNMEALIAPSDAGNGDMRGSKVESQLDELIGLFRVAFGPGGNFKNRSTFNDQNLEKQQEASKGWN